MSVGCLYRVGGYRRAFVEADLRKVCNDTISIVDTLVSKVGDSKEDDAVAGRVFFLKMKVRGVHGCHAAVVRDAWVGDYLLVCGVVVFGSAAKAWWGRAWQLWRWGRRPAYCACA